MMIHRLHPLGLYYARTHCKCFFLSCGERCESVAAFTFGPVESDCAGFVDGAESSVDSGVAVLSMVDAEFGPGVPSLPPRDPVALL